MVAQMDLRTVFDLAGMIADAPLGGDWHPALGAIQSTLGLSHVVLMREDCATGRQMPLSSQAGDVEMRYLEQYMPFNEAWPTLSVRPVGEPVLDRQTLPIERFERSLFYNEFALVNGMATSSGVIVGRDGDSIDALIVCHERRAPELERFDLDMLELLWRPVRRALRLWPGRDALARDDLDMWAGAPRASLVVDRRGRVLRANALASALLAAQAGELLVRRAYAGPDTLRADLWLRLQRCVSAGGSTMMWETGLHRYALSILPLPGPPASLGVRGSCHVVRFVEFGRPAGGAAEMLRTMFGLTPAEARVAVALGGEATLAGIAEALSVRLSTAKTLLSRAMLKTSTHSQAQLVRLVERLRALG